MGENNKNQNLKIFFIKLVSISLAIVFVINILFNLLNYLFNTLFNGKKKTDCIYSFY